MIVGLMLSVRISIGLGHQHGRCLHPGTCPGTGRAPLSPWLSLSLSSSPPAAAARPLLFLAPLPPPGPSGWPCQARRRLACRLELQGSNTPYAGAFFSIQANKQSKKNEKSPPVVSYARSEEGQTTRTHEGKRVLDRAEEDRSAAAAAPGARQNNWKWKVETHHCAIIRVIETMACKTVAPLSVGTLAWVAGVVLHELGAPALLVIFLQRGQLRAVQEKIVAAFVLELFDHSTPP